MKIANELQKKEVPKTTFTVIYFLKLHINFMLFSTTLLILPLLPLPLRVVGCSLIYFLSACTAAGISSVTASGLLQSTALGFYFSTQGSYTVISQKSDFGYP